MKNNLMKDKCPKKVRFREKIMFFFACAILIFSIALFLIVSNVSIGDLSHTGSAADSLIPGGEVVAEIYDFFSIVAAIAALVMILFLSLLICWSVGLIISLKLVLRKKELTRWMHTTSVVLMSIYLVLLSGLVVLTGVILI